MKIIDANLRNNFLEGLKNKRRSKSYAQKISSRLIKNNNDILAACFDVYNSGIIFPQGGALAKRKETPNIDVILVNLANKIYAYFMNKENASISEQCFDKFHADCCNSFINSINSARASVGYAPIYYGSAQKMVNMIFKYLVCYQDYADYANYFKWCHMPIDTVILRWLKERYQIRDIYYRVSINFKGKEELFANYKKKTWTKFDETLYRDILSLIREKINADLDFAGRSRLDVEFSIWG